MRVAACCGVDRGLLRPRRPGRPRARDLGIAPGALTPGRSTPSPTSPACASARRRSSRATRVRTGVTAILPHGGNLFQDKVPGAVFVGNAFGKLAGSTQVDELGTIETPIVLTNTLAVGTAVDAVVRWTLAQPGNEQRALGQRARRRDQRRHAERHPRPARHARARDGGDRRREGRARRRRRGRRRHRHDRVRLERRHRHVVARRCSSRARRWTVGVLVQTQLRRQADDRRRAGLAAS